MGSIFKVHDDHQNDGTLKTAVLGAHVEFTSIISTASVVTVFVVPFPSVSRELLHSSLIQSWFDIIMFVVR